MQCEDSTSDHRRRLYAGNVLGAGDAGCCRERLACDAVILGAFVRLLHRSEVSNENSFVLPKLEGYWIAHLLCTDVFTVQRTPNVQFICC